MVGNYLAFNDRKISANFSYLFKASFLGVFATFFYLAVNKYIIKLVQSWFVSNTKNGRVKNDVFVMSICSSRRSYDM